MNDLDQLKLHDICRDPKRHCELNGQVVVPVPLDLLERVTSTFDLVEIKRDLGRRRA